MTSSLLDVGLEIKILRERLKISSKDLAQKIGLSQSQMSRLEKGQRRIDIRVLNRISAALGVDPAIFFRAPAEAAGKPAAAELPGALPGGVPPEIAAPIPYEHLGKLVRHERRRRHLTIDELAVKVGRTKAYMAALEEGRHPLEADLADRIARALKLSTSFFVGVQEARIRVLEGQIARLNQALAEAHRGREGPGEEAGRRRIPLLGGLGPGSPIAFDAQGNPAGEPEDFLGIPGLDGSGCFAFTVAGDAMESPGKPSFREGDLVVFGTGGIPRSRDLVLARPAAGAAVFRQIFFEPDGSVRLQPLNLNHPARVHPRKELLGIWNLVLHIARG